MMSLFQSIAVNARVFKYDASRLGRHLTTDTIGKLRVGFAAMLDFNSSTMTPPNKIFDLFASQSVQHVRVHTRPPKQFPRFEL
jgi:hypothetical protein